MFLCQARPTACIDISLLLGIERMLKRTLGHAEVPIWRHSRRRSRGSHGPQAVAAACWNEPRLHGHRAGAPGLRVHRLRWLRPHQRCLRQVRLHAACKFRAAIDARHHASGRHHSWGHHGRHAHLRPEATRISTPHISSKQLRNVK